MIMTQVTVSAPKEDDRLRVDSWFTGRLGDFQQPLVSALLMDGRVELRVVFARSSPRAKLMSLLPLKIIQTPQIAFNLKVLAQLPWRLWKTLRELSLWYKNPPDITHVTMFSPIDILLLLVAVKSRARVLITVHDAVMHIGENRWLGDWLTSRMIGMADDIVVLSRHAEDLLRPRLLGRKPLHVLENGLIVNAGEPSPPKKPPGAGKPLKLLFFGRILAYKGLDLLLEAVRLVREQGGPDLHLTIAGSGDLSPYHLAIESLGDVSLHVGVWMSDAERDEYFAAADVQVVPYIDTSVSGIVLTGMWAGMATIATPLPAFADYLEEGVNALFSKSISAAALAEVIIRLAEDRELLASLAKGAHERAVSLSAPVVAAYWIDLYKKIATNTHI